MTPRTVRQVHNRINRRVAQDQVVAKVLRSKFSESIRYDIPDVFQPRGVKYERAKMRQFGHKTPWVRTGMARQLIPQTATVTATFAGGKVRVRAPWAGKAKPKKGGKGFAKQGFRVQQRLELEAIGKRQLERMARYAEKLWDQELKNPANLRKRTVKSSGG